MVGLPKEGSVEWEISSGGQRGLETALSQLTQARQGFCSVRWAEAGSFRSSNDGESI